MLCPQCNATMSKKVVMGRNAPRNEYSCLSCHFTMASTLTVEERIVFNIHGESALNNSQEYHREMPRHLLKRFMSKEV